MASQTLKSLAEKFDEVEAKLITVIRPLLEGAAIPIFIGTSSANKVSQVKRIDINCLYLLYFYFTFPIGNPCPLIDIVGYCARLNTFSARAGTSLST
jgi:hypothetical protein